MWEVDAAGSESDLLRLQWMTRRLK